jgi:ATP-dependent Zn protease
LVAPNNVGHGKLSALRTSIRRACSMTAPAGSTSSALVLGMPGTKHKLRQLVRLPRTAVAAAGDASPGGAVVRSVLLFGPQGCGKSELAKAMAAEAGARWVLSFLVTANNCITLCHLFTVQASSCTGQQATIKH